MEILSYEKFKIPASISFQIFLFDIKKNKTLAFET